MQGNDYNQAKQVSLLISHVCHIRMSKTYSLPGHTCLLAIQSPTLYETNVKGYNDKRQACNINSQCRHLIVTYL